MLRSSQLMSSTTPVSCLPPPRVRRLPRLTPRPVTCSGEERGDALAHTRTDLGDAAGNAPQQTCLLLRRRVH